ncbi:uncharacterized protein BDR25DRAFT_311810 [Lindgomyces ingoldianus]|uniref:Uncharacterized protein n=1 Tax=Lindgomyces ingoldianus TaxID=673940 RepID=A0ACB6R3D7_9PLEO|nr:uncharacterized protein BDR25DRAFT_311810 [Lindgomyces ingoldianus]KAF2473582.1 hypothetical protein BDR25DRAFT_311810 [Lindgomyces ingoldianus]
MTNTERFLKLGVAGSAEAVKDSEVQGKGDDDLTQTTTPRLFLLSPPSLISIDSTHRLNNSIQILFSLIPPPLLTNQQLSASMNILTKTKIMTTNSLSPDSVRLLTMHMHERLPRELRDQIYSYIWSDAVIRAMNYTSLLTLTIGGVDILEAVFTKIPTHYMHRAAAVEAAEWFYDHCTSIAINSPDEIKMFLETDVFGIGVVPKDRELRKLTIKIDVGSWKAPAGIYDVFAPLLQLKKREGFQLSLAFHAGEHGLQVVKMMTLGQRLNAVIDRLGSGGIKNVDVNFHIAMAHHNIFVVADIKKMVVGVNSEALSLEGWRKAVLEDEQGAVPLLAGIDPGLVSRVAPEIIAARLDLDLYEARQWQVKFRTLCRSLFRPRRY